MTHPAVVHLTHWKAGSQWVRSVLRRAAPDRHFVSGLSGLPDVAFFPGAIYSPAYLTCERLDAWAGEGERRTFCVMRDLRDTLISWYFSLLNSHPDDAVGYVDRQRATLRSLDQESGIIHLLESDGMRDMVKMQRSWIARSAPVFRYEDLVADEHAVFGRIFDYCALDVPPERRRSAIDEFTFERLAKRPRGDEDRSQHLRKGVAGDWRSHFTPAVKAAFKEHLGATLVATGYEPGLDW
jgi:lipopolysaccharide transport system ATP-binding protein